MKGYYKQQKKKNASKISKPSTKSGKKKTTTPSQSPALVSNHGSFDLQGSFIFITYFCFSDSIKKNSFVKILRYSSYNEC